MSFKNLVYTFILVLKNLDYVQVNSIMLQSDDEFLQNSKYITDRTFWLHFLTSGILFSLHISQLIIKNTCHSQEGGNLCVNSPNVSQHGKSLLPRPNINRVKL